MPWRGITQPATQNNQKKKVLLNEDGDIHIYEVPMMQLQVKIVYQKKVIASNFSKNKTIENRNSK